MNKKICPECGKEFDPSIDDFDSVKCLGCNFDSASASAYPEENELPQTVKKWLEKNYPSKDNIDPILSSHDLKSHTLPAELRKIDDVQQISSGWQATVRFWVIEVMDWVPPDPEAYNEIKHMYEAQLTFDDCCLKVLSAKVQKIDH